MTSRSETAITGMCPWCDETFVLDRFGALRNHKERFIGRKGKKRIGPETCPAVGLTPAEAELEAAK